ncbi:unnamed protein product [Clonostachys solani]|uniref:Uncharacterized protein n=1 Tax=Clonostachys solani TaxID=160281 RepID=A0A9P0EHL5_9HYPO|nr:unnamed protein product [Clonostachys solani]
MSKPSNLCLNRSWGLLNRLPRETCKPWSTLFQAAPSPASFDSPLVETVKFLVIREPRGIRQNVEARLLALMHPISLLGKAEAEGIDAAQSSSGMVAKRSQAELLSALAERVAMRGEPLQIARLGPLDGKGWRGVPVTTVALLVSNTLVAQDGSGLFQLAL